MRRLSRLFVGLSFFVLAVLCVFFFAQESRAQTAPSGGAVTHIGTHLIQGDAGAQAKVLNNLKANSLFPNYPIVVMVYPDGSAIPLLEKGQFAPIARVNIDCDTSADALRQLGSRMPPGIPVVVGNEINNANPANGEWKCGDYNKYVELFNAFADGFANRGPLGVSAMDTINGDYDALPVMNQIFPKVASRVTAVFANVYQTGGCGGYEAIRCSANGGQWVLDQVNKLTGKSFGTSDLYITEFGITTCGDYDCIQEFYEQQDATIQAKLVVGFTRPPGESGGSNWVHTVPAICEYWEGGSLTVQTPTKCGGAKKPIFVYPGIEDQTDELNQNRLAAGYMLTCGSKFYLHGMLSNEGEVLELAKANNIDCSAISNSGNADPHCVVPPYGGGIWADVYINNEKVLMPLFRFEGASAPNPDSETRRLDDLEGFFGAKYSNKSAYDLRNAISKGIESQNKIPLANGVSQKLTDEITMCKNKIGFLQSIKRLCETETNRSNILINNPGSANSLASPSPSPSSSPIPGECALYSEIPGVKPGFSSYRKVLEHVPSGFACEPEKLRLTRQRNPDWYEAFDKVELTISKGFKPAYIIRYLDRPVEWIDPKAYQKKVNWLAPGEEDNQGIPDPRNFYDRIKVVKVYVPAGFAERSSKYSDRLKPVSYATFQGNFMQVIQALLPKQLQDTIDTKQATEIEQIAGAMTNTKFNDPNPNVDKFVRCQFCNTLPKTDYRSSIVRRINTEIMLTPTSGRQFGDPLPACIGDDPLVGETVKERGHTINPMPNPDPVPRQTKITATAKLIAGKGGTESMAVRTFFLLPEEYRNINIYEQPFLTMFLDIKQAQKYYDPNEQIEKTHNEPLFISTEQQRSKDKEYASLQSYRYLQLTNAGGDISSPKQTAEPFYRYRSPDPNAPTPDPAVSPAPSPPSEKVALEGVVVGSVDPKDLNVAPLVPGGRLARALWEVMCNVTRPKVDPNDASKLTETGPYKGFEDFLKRGLAACTDGTEDGGKDQPADLCQGSTQVPAISGVKALVKQIAGEMGVDANALWGIFSMEGGQVFRAWGSNPNQSVNVACKPNSVGAVGPLGILVKACGGVYDNWERYSKQAGVPNKSACDLDASLRVAATILKIFYANPTQSGDCAPSYPSLPASQKRWVQAAASYNGSCTPLVGAGFGCEDPKKSGNWLTYGECAIVKYGPGL